MHCDIPGCTLPTPQSNRHFPYAHTLLQYARDLIAKPHCETLGLTLHTSQFDLQGLPQFTRIGDTHGLPWHTQPWDTQGFHCLYSSLPEQVSHGIHCTVDLMAQHAHVHCELRALTGHSLS